MNSTGMPTNQYTSAYSVPEESKQEYGEPGIFVSQHRTLPHLVKRRQYVSDGVESPGVQPSASPVDQRPSGSPGPTSSPTEPKQKSGLDLDNVPRPNVVSGENTVQGIHCNAKAQITNIIPCPNSTTRHYTPDEGNSIFRLFRVTSQSILMDGISFFNSSNMPFGAIAQPFADLSEYETPIPTSKFGGDNLIRCGRCGAYVNPGFAFVQPGVDFRCNLCEGVSQVKSAMLLGNEDRPELTLGTYDFNAPEVLKGKMMTGNNLLLVIDGTQNSINNGTLKE